MKITKLTALAAVPVAVLGLGLSACAGQQPAAAPPTKIVYVTSPPKVIHVTSPAKTVTPKPAAPAPAPSPTATPTSTPAAQGDPSPGSGTGAACTTVPGGYWGPVSLPGHQDSSGFCVADPQPPAAPAAPPAQIVNAEAVVTQFYQDITDQNYPAAWALGGDNLSGGVGYSQWVAGYATTASISLGTFSSFGSDQVAAALSAVQTDGSVRTYQGTYTVQNGVIVSANIVQTS